MLNSRLLFAVVFLAAVVFAVLYPVHSIGYLVLYTLLLLLITAFVSVVWAPRHIVVEESVQKDAAFKNERLQYAAGMRNRSLFFYPALRTLRYSRDVLQYNGEALPLSLSPKSSIRREYVLQFPYRGVYRVGVERMVVTDFLGLFRRTLFPPSSLSVVVYPELDENFVMAMRSELINTVFSYVLFNEDYTSVADVRKYTPTDSIRKMHWKLSAKRGELLVKNYQSFEPNKTLLFLDTLALPLPEAEAAAFEDQMVSHVASAIQYFQQSRIPTGFVYGDMLRDPLLLDAETDMDKVLRVLAQVAFADVSSGLPACLRSVDKNLGPVNIVAFLCAVDDEIHNALKEYISLGHDVLLYYFYSPALPLTGAGEDLLESLRAYGVYVYKVALK